MGYFQVTMEAEDFSYEEISQPYYFETDHVALKDNPDYRTLLHAIAVLESQRQQAARDIEELYRAQEKSLADPFKFVEKLQQGKHFNFPLPQKIAPLPELQWSKYTSSIEFSSFGASRHMTRNKRNVPDNNGDTVQGLKSKLIQGSEISSGGVENTGSDGECVVVRGRSKGGAKSATFNKLWTDEEQQRLESLLIQFPPEEVEAKRWAKIAAALGNRTSIQVASRVQKYFLRLAKEGLPVPGRTPNLAPYYKKGYHRHNKYSRLYYPHSTFLQSHLPPVWMKDDTDEFERQQTVLMDSNGGDSGTLSESASVKNEESSDEEEYADEIKNCPEYLELQRLLRMKKEKLAQDCLSSVRHDGFKCDNCGCDPIVGTRWHCIDCPSELSVDLCDDCCDVCLQQGQHDSSHRLHPFTSASLNYDCMGYSMTDYNYLDPNYLPAS